MPYQSKNVHNFLLLDASAAGNAYDVIQYALISDPILIPSIFVSLLKMNSIKIGKDKVLKKL